MLAARERDYIIGLPECPRCGGQVLRRQGGSRECAQCGHDPDRPLVLLTLSDEQAKQVSLSALVRRSYKLLTYAQCRPVYEAWGVRCIGIRDFREWLSSRVADGGGARTPSRANLCEESNAYGFCEEQADKGKCAKCVHPRPVLIPGGRAKLPAARRGSITQWVANLLSECGGNLSTQRLSQERQQQGYSKNSCFDALRRLGARHEGPQNTGWWVL